MNRLYAFKGATLLAGLLHVGLAIMCCANLFAGHFEFEVTPGEKLEKVTFSYSIKKVDGLTRFELHFAENPSNKDGELWATSIFSYGRLVIKAKSEIIADININNSFLGKGEAVFEFQLKNDLIENSYFEFATYPAKFKSLKEYILYKWEFIAPIEEGNNPKQKSLEERLAKGSALITKPISPYPMYGNFYIVKLKKLKNNPTPKDKHLKSPPEDADSP